MKKKALEEHFQAIASNDTPFGLRHYALEAWVGEEHPQKTQRGFRVGISMGEVVLIGDSGEGSLTDAARSIPRRVKPPRVLIGG